MAELPERDAALKGLDEDAFLASRLHQNAIRSLEILGEAAGNVSAAAIGAAAVL